MEQIILSTFFVVAHQFLSVRLVITVYLGYIKTDCTVNSSSVSKSPSLQLFLYPCAPLNISNTYVCLFTKLYFRKAPSFTCTFAYSASVKKSTVQQQFFHTHRTFFKKFIASFERYLCLLLCFRRLRQ